MRAFGSDVWAWLYQSRIDVWPRRSMKSWLENGSLTTSQTAGTPARVLTSSAMCVRMRLASQELAAAAPSAVTWALYSAWLAGTLEEALHDTPL
jgi:hypothetical protein